LADVVFSISAGTLTDADTGAELGPAYSGAPGHVGVVADVALVGAGPIPPGRWTIGAPVDDLQTGPFSLPLTPEPGTETYGRSAFLIHGDNPSMNESASHGCVIAARDIREAISRDYQCLVVTA
jgi:hypothetical protein